MKIYGAYLGKALSCTAIKPEDGKMRHAYTLYLRECCNVRQHLLSQYLQYLEELEIPANLRLTASKHREKWRTRAHETQQRTGRVRFQHLVDFGEKH